MAEDSKENPPSQQGSAEQEKKQVVSQAPPRPAPAPQSARPAGPATPPKPRPPATLPPQPPSAQPPKSTGRRTFLKLFLVVGAVLSVLPFVPWGSYLSSSISSTGAYKRQQAVLDLNTPSNRNANGSVAGKVANVNDLAAFPPNSSWLITYPSSGDVTVDSQNIDTFVKFSLIRLPQELGGSEKSAAAFVAFSKVCVHLWCSPNYDPEHTANKTDQTYQCPCHGSIYEVPDGLSVAGPASEQAYPTNAIPMLTLTADANGDLYIEPPLWDVNHNGIIGYGRDFQSYQSYILPAAKGQA